MDTSNTNSSIPEPTPEPSQAPTPELHPGIVAGPPLSRQSHTHNAGQEAESDSIELPRRRVTAGTTNEVSDKASLDNDPATRPTSDFAPRFTSPTISSPKYEQSAFSDYSAGAAESKSNNKAMADAKTVGPAVGKALIPRRLGAVVLQRQVGEGGMGVVWLGRHELLNRDVAVKFLLNAVAEKGDASFESFIEGARAAAALRSPGLNAVLHADVVDGVPYLVMEYVEGPTLSRVLRSCVQQGQGGFSTGMSLAAARVVLDCVCAAIGELHEHGIIHRDIKPANILFTSDAKPVVTDFGLSCERSTSATGGAGTMGTVVENIAGTPEYMAPEMFEQTISPRSDVYALGIMAYELLEGRTPFRGTLDEIRTAQTASPLPVDAVARFPEAIAQVIERATSKNPMYRYKSARHLQRAFEEAFAHIDPMIASKALGESEVARLVARLMRGSAASGGTQISSAGGASDGDDSAQSDSKVGGNEAGLLTPTPQETYFDRLATLRKDKADSKQKVDTAIPDDLVTRVEVNISCVRCKQSLKGLQCTGRCPNCLLLVMLSMPGGVAQLSQGSGGTTSNSNLLSVTGRETGSISPSKHGVGGSAGQPSSEGALPLIDAHANSGMGKARPKGLFGGTLHDIREFWRQFFAK